MIIQLILLFSYIQQAISATCSTNTDCSRNQICSSNVCVGIPCSATGYQGLPGACLCAAGYTGTVIYVSGALTGCSPCPYLYTSVAGNGNTCTYVPCTNSPGVIGRAPNCTCDFGYTGFPTYKSGVYNYCNRCPSGKWAPAGIGQICTTIDPSSVTGTSCATNTNCPSNQVCISGKCAGIPCSSYPGYAGNPGQCTCDNGYEGTVTYSAGMLSGCLPCSRRGTGYWATRGNGNVCTLVPCSSSGPAYNGTAPSCMCSEGYNGYAEFFNGGYRYCDLCPNGTWAATGNDNLCAAISPTSASSRLCITDSGCNYNEICIYGKCTLIPCGAFPGYTGPDGNCECDNGYEGTVIYRPGQLSGCSSCYANYGIGYWTQSGLGNSCTLITDWLV